MKKRNGLKRATVFTMALASMVGTLAAAPQNIFAEEITTEENTVTADNTAMHYDVRDGGTWDGTNYYLTDGTLVKNAFFCDGTYTYYLQNDGTAMKDRLTYHPDGEHIIYFDASGHEVFSNFTNVKQSIAGEAVDDLCFFDTYGYMYVDFITYDQAGVNLYYANPYGVMERNGWFTFSNKQGGGLGYANPDGTLAVNQNVYDQNGNLVYLQGNGKVQGSENSAANSDAASTGTTDAAGTTSGTADSSASGTTQTVTMDREQQRCLNNYNADKAKADESGMRYDIVELKAYNYGVTNGLSASKTIGWANNLGQEASDTSEKKVAEKYNLPWLTDDYWLFGMITR